MTDFSAFIEGNVLHIPEMKDEKDGIHLSDDWPGLGRYHRLNSRCRTSRRKNQASNQQDFSSTR
jgi:hypothetical protein